MNTLGDAALLLSMLGLALTALGALLLVVHLHHAPEAPRKTPPISILKPLCGVDDDLEVHLDLFASLDYPDYEVVLGVRDTTDPAWPLARAAEARHPGRVRAVVQRGEPGLNPKVNQLITLAAAARHEILVVSDSNVRVERDYLQEIAAALGDPRVGVVTHVVAGEGERSLGSLLDHLHMCSAVSPGMVAAMTLLRLPMVVGKSMAMRRADLAAIGGFEGLRDLLAEDYLTGTRMRALGKRIHIARTPIFNVSRRRTVGDFVSRYNRWSVMQRQAVGPVKYLFGLVLIPLCTAVVALCASPSRFTVAWLLAVVLGNLILDAICGAALRPTPFGARQLLAVPLKDVLFAYTWFYGALHDTIAWRSHTLRVLPGTWLERVTDLDEAAVEPQARAS